MRMLGPRGNPQARNLFEGVDYLQHAEVLRFEVRPASAASRRKDSLTTWGQSKQVKANRKLAARSNEVT